jgi:hypothetical protein
MELTRIDDVAGDPFEGSNVTLSCRTYGNTASSTPPKWFYQINGKGPMHIINETNPPEGLKLPLIGIADSLNSNSFISFNISGIFIIQDTFVYKLTTFYESQLFLPDISPSSYTFQCQGSGLTENISFRAKGI